MSESVVMVEHFVSYTRIPKSRVKKQKNLTYDSKDRGKYYRGLNNEQLRKGRLR